MEEGFCQLVALGHSARDAYAEAFGRGANDVRSQHAVDNRASRLMKRPDIVARISEAQGEQRRRDQKKWRDRGDELAERIYQNVCAQDEAGRLLTVGALKGIEVLAKLKGLNAPEEHTLRNGGVTDDFKAPRALEGMTDEALDDIIEHSEGKDGGE